MAAGKGGIILILDAKEGDLEPKVNLNLQNAWQTRHILQIVTSNLFRCQSADLFDMVIYEESENSQPDKKKITRRAIIAQRGEIYEFNIHKNNKNELAVQPGL